MRLFRTVLAPLRIEEMYSSLRFGPRFGEVKQVYLHTNNADIIFYTFILRTEFKQT